jgi:hypothetical protein
MKTIYTILFFITTAMLFAANPDAAALQHMEPEAPKIDPFYRKIHDVLEILKQKKIVNENGLTENEKNRIVEALLKSIRSDLRYIPSNSKDLVMECAKSSQSHIFQPVSLRNGRIIYFRIDYLSDDSVSKLIVNYEKSLSASNAPEGVVLDLRNCRSFEIQNAGRIASAFFNMPTQNIQKNGVKNQPNCAILIGETTIGTPEAVTWLAEKSKNVITLGVPSAGMPFKPEMIKLPDNSSLLVPQIPDAYKDMPDGPVKPVIDAISIKAVNQQHEQGVFAEDPCVMKASDMLISLNTFNKVKR